MSILRNKPFEIYFPEPEGKEPKFSRNTPSIELVSQSTTKYGVIGRIRLNAWLNDWDYGDRKDILARVKLKNDTHHEAAVWELYLNSLFKHLGFHVQRDPRKGNGKTPDFKMRKLLKFFYLEATIIADGPESTAQSHWKNLLSEIEKIERVDFCISIHPVIMSKTPPKVNKIKREIVEYLNTLTWKPSENLMDESGEEFHISVADWQLRIRAIPWPEKLGGRDFIAISSDGRNPLINDLGDLKKKIEKKRKRYKDLDAPYVLAILENSFLGGDDNWHRFGALFGQEAIQIAPDGTTHSVRLRNGTWDPDVGDKNIEALLLLNRLRYTFDALDFPELWMNPQYKSSRLNMHIPFTYFNLQEGNYESHKRSFEWDGSSKPKFGDQITRILTKIIFR